MKKVQMLLGRTTVVAVAAAMMMAALGLAGCGGGAKVKSEQSTYTTTLGQELKDLEDSYKKGIITEQQYEEAKEKLIEQRTKKK